MMTSCYWYIVYLKLNKVWYWKCEQLILKICVLYLTRQPRKVTDLKLLANILKKPENFVENLEFLANQFFRRNVFQEHFKQDFFYPK